MKCIIFLDPLYSQKRGNQTNFQVGIYASFVEFDIFVLLIQPWTLYI